MPRAGTNKTALCQDSTRKKVENAEMKRLYSLPEL